MAGLIAQCRPPFFLAPPLAVSRRVYAALALALVLAGGTLAWWVSRPSQTAPPARQSIAGLLDTTDVGWTARHTAVVEASDPSDALTALGYVHGMQRAWTITVWRRTALGTLASTFGDRLLSIDRHVRRLGLAHCARRAYAQLPGPARRRLQAYTRGLNAALRAPSVRRRTPFVALPVQPKRWQPWHPLAVERLWAWLSTSPSLFAEQSSLHAADRQLRRWLHLHGQARSLAWAARPSADTAGTVLFARHVLGRTAAPVLQEVLFRRPTAPPLTVASVPGTLLFPTGASGRRAWTYLLHSPAEVVRRARPLSSVRRRHERITAHDGAEHLLTARHVESGLVLDTAQTDSARVLRWPGLDAHSDVGRWTSLAGLGPGRPPPEPLRLFSGDGLAVDTSGTWTVRGQPPVVETRDRAVLVGRSAWAASQARALQAHSAAAPPAPEQWSRNDLSAWAGATLPRMLPDLAPLSGTAPLIDEALSYLRNWNHAYERASIGAVLYEEWMRAYRAEIGRVPGGEAPAYMAGPRRRRTFRDAVVSLAQKYGRDVRRWRWERVASEQRLFPVWSADSLVSLDLSPFAGTRFAPLNRPGRGHASTPAGGPSPVAPLPLGTAPARWEGWVAPGRGLAARRLRVDPSAFFERSLLSRKHPVPVSVSKASAVRTTRLVPARQ